MVEIKVPAIGGQHRLRDPDRMQLIESTADTTCESVRIFRAFHVELKFTFELWAYAKMPVELAQRAYRAFLAEHYSPAERETLRGVTLTRLTNWGLADTTS